MVVTLAVNLSNHGKHEAIRGRMRSILHIGHVCWCRSGHMGLRIGARLPLVARQQHAIPRAIVVYGREAQFNRARVTISDSLVPFGFLENPVRTTLTHLLKGDGHLLTGAILIGKDHLAVAVGTTGNLRHHAVIVVVGSLVARVGFTQRKLHTSKLIAILVDLHDTRFRNVHEVVLKRHVGVGVAALKIEEVEGVVGVVSEGRARQPGGHAGGAHNLRDGLAIAAVIERLALVVRVVVAAAIVIAKRAVIIDVYATCGEVNLDRSGVVDATQIAHKHAVDINPYVVVAREVIGNLLTTLRPIGSRVATVLLNKTGGHVQTEVVVNYLVGRDKIPASLACIDLLFDKLAILLIENLVTRVEREELAIGRWPAASTPHRLYSVKLPLPLPSELN